MHLNPGKRLARPQNQGKTLKIVVDVSLRVVCWASTSLVAAMSVSFGLRLRQETTMDDPVENVQPYPVEPFLVKMWPERRGEGNSPLSRRRRGGAIGG